MAKTTRYDCPVPAYLELHREIVAAGLLAPGSNRASHLPEPMTGNRGLPGPLSPCCRVQWYTGTLVAGHSGGSAPELPCAPSAGAVSGVMGSRDSLLAMTEFRQAVGIPDTGLVSKVPRPLKSFPLHHAEAAVVEP